MVLSESLIRLSMAPIIFMYKNFQINFYAAGWDVKKNSAYIMAWEKSRRIFTTLWLGWWEGTIFDFLEYFSPSSRSLTHRNLFSWLFLEIFFSFWYLGTLDHVKIYGKKWLLGDWNFLLVLDIVIWSYICQSYSLTLTTRERFYWPTLNHLSRLKKTLY